jgi:hypothetical protein
MLLHLFHSESGNQLIFGAVILKLPNVWQADRLSHLVWQLWEGLH